MIIVKMLFCIIAIILTIVALIKTRQIQKHIKEIIKITEQSALEYKPRRKAS